MKTESLIDMLARQAGPAPRAMAARRLTPAVAGGLVLAVAGALAWIGPIPAELYADPGPWIKFGYAGLLAARHRWRHRRAWPAVWWWRCCCWARRRCCRCPATSAWTP